MYDLAQRLHEDASLDAVFLRAPRATNGEARFQLRDGAPQPTSHGEDIYEQIFGETP
jgi:hypothetical protein